LLWHGIPCGCFIKACSGGGGSKEQQQREVNVDCLSTSSEVSDYRREQIVMSGQARPQRVDPKHRKVQPSLLPITNLVPSPNFCQGPVSRPGRIGASSARYTRLTTAARQSWRHPDTSSLAAVDRCTTSRIPGCERNSKAPAPGRWKISVAQLNTTFSHQPGFGLRQPSAGHGTLCLRHQHGSELHSISSSSELQSALVKGTTGGRHRSCCPRPTALSDQCIAPTERLICSISNYDDTVPPVFERRRVVHTKSGLFPATSNRPVSIWRCLVGSAEDPTGTAQLHSAHGPQTDAWGNSYRFKARFAWLGFLLHS
ncbi:hypothetical protein J1614_011097, partial [Plenodomus biglobosus]